MFVPITLAVTLWFTPPPPDRMVSVKLTPPSADLTLPNAARGAQTARIASAGIPHRTRAIAAPPPVWLILLPGGMSILCLLIAVALAPHARKRPAPGKGRAVV